MIRRSIRYGDHGRRCRVRSPSGRVAARGIRHAPWIPGMTPHVQSSHAAPPAQCPPQAAHCPAAALIFVRRVRHAQFADIVGGTREPRYRQSLRHCGDVRSLRVARLLGSSCQRCVMRVRSRIVSVRKAPETRRAPRTLWAGWSEPELPKTRRARNRWWPVRQCPIDRQVYRSSHPYFRFTKLCGAFSGQKDQEPRSSRTCRGKRLSGSARCKMAHFSRSQAAPIDARSTEIAIAPPDHADLRPRSLHYRPASSRVRTAGQSRQRFHGSDGDCWLNAAVGVAARVLIGYLDIRATIFGAAGMKHPETRPFHAG